MKTQAVRLNALGIIAAKEFMVLNDKYSSYGSYNMAMAVREIERKVCESESHSYELTSLDSRDSTPRIISFSDNMLVFEDVEEA